MNLVDLLRMKEFIISDIYKLDEANPKLTELRAKMRGMSASEYIDVRKNDLSASLDKVKNEILNYNHNKSE